MASTSLTPLQVLQQYYGYQQFRPLQQEAIDSVLSGQDAFVLMPTGGGKSLCYAIPSLIQEGITIVVSPLISLMKDQVDNLQQNGIPAAFLNSTQSEIEQQQTLSQAQSGQISLLYVAPERLVQTAFRQWLHQIKLNFFAIDEAHCISQWGHDFRPEYRQLSLLRQEFPQVPIMALTATATTRVKADIVHQLSLDQPNTLVASFFRSNLYYSVEPKKNTKQSIATFVKERPDQPGIVYCQSRNAVERLCQYLQSQHISATIYHAGLTEQERRTNQDLFKQDEVQVIVATVAFGMGIDKSNIRFVIHESAPRSLEHYYQETGRAGRDGQPSQCLMFFSSGDLQLYRQFSQDLPQDERQASFQKINQVQQFALSTGCRHYQLLNYFSEQRLEQQCTSCDNCLHPRQTFDATTLCQQIFSCIYHLKRPYASTYISQILTGSTDERIMANQHHQLSVHGLVKNYTAAQLRQIIIELSNQGYLTIDLDHYNQISLTPASLPILKGQQSVHLSDLYAPGQKKVKPVKVPSSSTAAVSYNQNDIDQDLFEKLRALRKKIAQAANVPPYIVFADTALTDMAIQQPTTLDQFANIYGVGQQKLEKYGQQFIDCINQYLK